MLKIPTKSPLRVGLKLQTSPPPLRRGFGGGSVKNTQNSTNSLNLKENSQILQDKSVENSNNAKNTHPQTPPNS